MRRNRSDQKQHKAIRNICREWEDLYALETAKQGAWTILKIFPLLYVGDLLLLEPQHYRYFMLPRLALGFLFVANAIFLTLFSRSRFASSWGRVVATYGVLVTLGSLSTCYLGFYFLGLPQYYAAITYANLVIACFGTVFTYRLWKEQYLFNMLSLIQFIMIAWTMPALRPEMTALCEAELGAAACAFFLRRDFFRLMFLRYETLCMLLPPALAGIAAAAQDDHQVLERFAPRRRFAACLCLDWRDFQSLAANNSSEFVATAFEEFYDIVLGWIERMYPSDGYLLDWNADELFIVFFGEEEQQQEVLKRGLAFAHVLCVAIFEEARRSCGFKVVYDVGLAAGFGLIGLMGPKTRRKATVAAQAAGIAKRLETEAKTHRCSLSNGNPYPILAFGAELLPVAQGDASFSAAPFQGVIATAKDIADSRCYVWQHTLATVSLAVPAVIDESLRKAS